MNRKSTTIAGNGMLRFAVVALTLGVASAVLAQSYDLTWHTIDDGGGIFQSIGLVAGVAPNYAQWNGKAWKTPPAGEVAGSVFALAVAKGQAGTTLYSGGWIKGICC